MYGKIRKRKIIPKLSVYPSYLEHSPMLWNHSSGVLRHSVCLPLSEGSLSQYQKRIVSNLFIFSILWLVTAGLRLTGQRKSISWRLISLYKWKRMLPCCSSNCLTTAISAKLCTNCRCKAVAPVKQLSHTHKHSHQKKTKKTTEFVSELLLWVLFYNENDLWNYRIWL